MTEKYIIRAASSSMVLDGKWDGPVRREVESPELIVALAISTWR